MPDPGWVRDPSGRYHQRFFDGTNWTDHVADEYGRRGLDPVDAIARTVAPPASAPVPAVIVAAPAPTDASAVPRGVDLATVVGAVGLLVGVVTFSFLPWLGTARASAMPQAVSGVWESSFFDAGWIVTTVVAGLTVLGLATGAVGRAVRSMMSAVAAACAAWAVVGTLMLKGRFDDLGGSISLGYGCFVGVAGIVAVAVAPLLPDRPLRRR